MIRYVLLGWPLPKWVYPTVAVIIAGLTFVVNLSLLRSAYPLWSQVSTAWHESLMVPGAVLAVFAAAIGTSFSQKASPVTPGGRPREGVWTMLGHATALGVWAVLGHGVGMAPAVTRAVFGATWGTLDWQDVCVGSVGVLMLSVTGFFYGVFVRQWLLAPVVGLFVLVALYAPNTSSLRPFGLFSPVRQYSTSTRFELTPVTSVFAVIAMVTLSLAVAHLVTWAHRSGAAYQKHADAIIWTGALMALAAIAFTWRPELYRVDQNTSRTCQNEASVRICLHNANEPARDDVTSAATSVAGSGLGPLLEQVTDYAIAKNDERNPGEALLALDPGPFGQRDFIQSVLEGSADAIVDDLTVNLCRQTEEVFDDSNPDPAEPSRALRDRVLVLAGFERLVENSDDLSGEAPGFFAAMSREELTAWVRQHQDEIRTCTISVQ